MSLRSRDMRNIVILAAIFFLNKYMVPQGGFGENLFLGTGHPYKAIWQNIWLLTKKCGLTKKSIYFYWPILEYNIILFLTLENKQYVTNTLRQG